MAKEGKQCSPVDPNYSAGEQSNEKYLGASEPMSHPLMKSPVDPNYSSGGNGGGAGGPSPRVQKSSPVADDAGSMEKDSAY